MDGNQIQNEALKRLTSTTFTACEVERQGQLLNQYIEHLQKIAMPPMFLGVDVGKEQSRTAVELMQRESLVNSLCGGVCQPHRSWVVSERKHVESRIVEPKQLAGSP
jgi:hypothetical protein